MTYLLAGLVGYYLLEVLRHLVKQFSKWDKSISELAIADKGKLLLLILATAIFWPVFYFFRRSLCNESRS